VARKLLLRNDFRLLYKVGIAKQVKLSASKISMKLNRYETPTGSTGSLRPPICKDDEGGGDDYSEESFP